METGRTPLQRYYHQEDYTCGRDSSEIKIQRRFIGELELLHTSLRKCTQAVGECGHFEGNTQKNLMHHAGRFCRELRMPLSGRN